MRFRFTLLLFAALLGSACATAQDPFATPPINGEHLYRALHLSMSFDGKTAVCHAFYLMPTKKGDYFRSFILSAGHCPTEGATRATLVKNEWQDWQWTRPLSSVDNGNHEHNIRYDFFLADVVERRPTPEFFTIDESRPMPTDGEIAIMVASKPSNLGRQPALLQKLKPLKGTYVGLLAFEAEQDGQPGFSGAAVATTGGRLLGIMISIDKKNHKIYYVMPIKTVLDELRKLVQR